MGNDGSAIFLYFLFVEQRWKFCLHLFDFFFYYFVDLAEEEAKKTPVNLNYCGEVSNNFPGCFFMFIV